MILTCELWRMSVGSPCRPTWSVSACGRKRKDRGRVGAWTGVAEPDDADGVRRSGRDVAPVLQRDATMASGGCLVSLPCAASIDG